MEITLENLRRSFCKDRVWLGTICKRFSDFAENVDTSVLWAETTENEVRNLKKKFVLRYGGNFKNLDYERLKLLKYVKIHF